MNINKIIVTTLLFLAIITTPIVADASNGSTTSKDGSGFGAIIMIAGPGYYVLIKKKYADTHIRDEYEKETSCVLLDMKCEDTFSKTLKDTTSKSIRNYKSSLVAPSNDSPLERLKSQFKV